MYSLLNACMVCSIKELYNIIIAMGHCTMQLGQFFKFLPDENFMNFMSDYMIDRIKF